MSSWWRLSALWTYWLAAQVPDPRWATIESWMSVPKLQLCLVLRPVLLKGWKHYFWKLRMDKVLMLANVHCQLYMNLNHLGQAYEQLSWLGSLRCDDLPTVGEAILWAGMHSCANIIVRQKKMLTALFFLAVVSMWSSDLSSYWLEFSTEMKYTLELWGKINHFLLRCFSPGILPSNREGK